MRTVVLTAHLSGVAILFVMITIEVIALCGAPRAATVTQLRSALYAVGASEKLAVVATVLILVSGLALVARSPGFAFSDGWIIVAIVLTVVLAVMGSTVQGRHMEMLARRADDAGEGAITPELASLARDRLWHASAWSGVGMAFAFLYLMVAKPNLLFSILAFVVGSVVGVTAGFVLLARATARAPSPVPTAPTASR